MAVSRGTVGVVLAATLLALPVATAPGASAAIAPNLALAMSGSALGLAGTASVGCAQTVVATLERPDGTPITHGTVDFFSNLSGISGNFVGTVPVAADGSARIGWIPGVAGAHVISAVYYDGGSDYQQVAGNTSVTAVNLGGVCV
ncbi:hypothetical protein D5S18_15195 [Nocardia panacis]|uniref:Ig-like domain repeat protein n=1 Tax=Nocardia panacis TaxID=2340916 RepID=A0A3A4KJI1_9NOCA|nr:hypothetical protein D5S18_15195 [Nocardia panacis]